MARDEVVRFRVSEEDQKRLEEIRKDAGLEYEAEALRHCIRVAYNQLVERKEKKESGE